MALIKCGECERQISSLAECCPGCGWPVPRTNERDATDRHSATAASAKDLGTKKQHEQVDDGAWPGYEAHPNNRTPERGTAARNETADDDDGADGGDRDQNDNDRGQRSAADHDARGWLDERSRQVGGGLLVVGTALLLFAAFTRSWWTFDNEDMFFKGGFGLLAWGHRTGSMSYSDFSPNAMVTIQPAFLWLGRATFALVIVTSIVCAYTVLSIALRRAFHGLAWRVGAATAIAGAAFTLLAGEIGKLPVSFGVAFYVFWVGILAVVTGDRILNLDRRSLDVGSSTHGDPRQQ